MKPEITITDADLQTPIADQNLERLLGQAYKPDTPDQAFAERLKAHLCSVASTSARARRASSRKHSRYSPALCLGDGCGCIHRPDRPPLARSRVPSRLSRRLSRTRSTICSSDSPTASA